MYLPPITTLVTTPTTTDARKLKAGAASRRTKSEAQWERRRQPDRRQPDAASTTKATPTDKRKRRDRRQPKLLNARSAKPEKISEQKGRTIDISV